MKEKFVLEQSMFPIDIELNTFDFPIIDMDELCESVSLMCKDFDPYGNIESGIIEEIFENNLSTLFLECIETEYQITTNDSTSNYKTDGDCKYFELVLSTDLETIFTIHKDVCTKYRAEFTSWLKDVVKNKNCYANVSFDEFLICLQGRNLEIAISLFLQFLLSKNVANLIDFNKNIYEELCLSMQYDTEC